MRLPTLHLALGCAAALLLASAAPAQVFTHTEARHTHSLALTPDGTRLLALNTDAAQLSVFDLTGGSLAAPVLAAEIPVGLEPVAVRARTNDEAWVVSELGDSVAIVSLSRGTVVATLRTPDEPADVVFAGGKAFVTCARNQLVRVFDAVTRHEQAPIGLEGVMPRALAGDAAGTKLFAAFLHSGNRTTILPASQAPLPPAPANTALPPAPKTALIVPAGDSRIHYTVLDHDVAEIAVSTGTVTRYLGGAGTNLFDLAVQPGTGDVWVANTEALNLTAFEPNLRGHFIDHRLTRLAAMTGASTVFDLNPGIDYGLLPNPAAQANALAQPSAVLFTADGSELWVAAFGSDRIARVSAANGAVLGVTDLRGAGEGARKMRGPRALALDETGARLFVLNKLSNTLSVVDAQTGAWLGEVAIGTRHPMPAAIREGRGFLFDARLSGNGASSCATCHLDADRDGLAWDLGDPAGEMVTVMGANNSAHDPRPRPRSLHPMKGPMTTQTLRGLTGGAPFHWRGDRPTLESFNQTFDRLMGGAPLPEADMQALAAYLGSLRHHPNPNRLLDGALPAQLNGGNPTRGSNLFAQHLNHCAVCHTGSRGTDNNLDLHTEVGSSQPIKNPPLATVYQRALFNPQAGQASLTGFGLLHDGTGSILPTVHPYVLDVLEGQDFADVAAFVLAFDTGTAPSVGNSVTVNSANAGAAAADIARLETRAQFASLDLVVRGVVGGQVRRYFYARSLQQYVPDQFGAAPLSRAALLAALGEDDTITFLGVPSGEGGRFGGDLDRNATLFADSYFTRSKTAPLVVPAALGVLANDLRVAPPADVPNLVNPPGEGAAVISGDGSFRFTPAPGFGAAGLDAFTYRVWIGGDSGNVTALTTATISTVVSAAGRYFGVLEKDGTGELAGFVSVTLTGTGAFTGTARLGNVVQPLRGNLAVDGELRLAPTPKLTLTLLLSAQNDGRRRLRANVRSGADLFIAAAMQRSPFSAAVPAPRAGRATLTLAVGTATTGAPAGAGRATLVITKAGLATLTGRLADNTAFTFSAPLAERPGGGWLLHVWAPIFRFPPGSLAGRLELDPSVSPLISGSLLAIRPAQTKPAGAPGPYSIRYDATEPAP